MLTAEEQALVVSERLSLPDGQGATLLRLNRPAQRNPLDWGTVRALEAALASAYGDDSRAVLVTGAGTAFSAGGDLSSYRELQRDPTAFPRFLEDIHRTFSAIRQAPKPVIALVNGAAVAGGLELVLSCDLALAAAGARIGDGHLNHGQMGGGGALTLLPRTIGPARARELVLSGRLLTAEEALAWGIVSRVVDGDALVEAGLALAAEIAAHSSLAVANAKQVMNAAFADGTAIDAALRLERERTAYYCLTSDDAPEGLAAFAEKRPPRWRGT